MVCHTARAFGQKASLKGSETKPLVAALFLHNPRRSILGLKHTHARSGSESAALFVGAWVCVPVTSRCTCPVLVFN